MADAYWSPKALRDLVPELEPAAWAFLYAAVDEIDETVEHEDLTVDQSEAVLEFSQWPLVGERGTLRFSREAIVGRVPAAVARSFISAGRRRHDQDPMTAFRPLRTGDVFAMSPLAGGLLFELADKAIAERRDQRALEIFQATAGAVVIDTTEDARIASHALYLTARGADASQRLPEGGTLRTVPESAEGAAQAFARVFDIGGRAEQLIIDILDGTLGDNGEALTPTDDHNLSRVIDCFRRPTGAAFGPLTSLVSDAIDRQPVAEALVAVANRGDFDEAPPEDGVLDSLIRGHDRAAGRSSRQFAGPTDLPVQLTEAMAALSYHEALQMEPAGPPVADIEGPT